MTITDERPGGPREEDDKPATEVQSDPETGVAATEEEDNNSDNDNDDEDDDNITVIVLNSDSGNASSNRTDMMTWMERAGPEMEDRRRNVLLRELRRVQRASFVHFALLCVIPTILLLIVIGTVLGDEEECVSDVTYCELEPRSFVTAFTTRCICDAIPVQQGSGSG